MPAEKFEPVDPDASNLKAGRLMASFSSEGLMMHRDGIVLCANRSFAILTGVKDEEGLIGKRISEIIPFTEESKQRFAAALQADAHEFNEVELIGADGDVIAAEIRNEAIVCQGEPAQLITLRDNTRYKQIDIKLARMVEHIDVLHSLDQAIASVMDLPLILNLLVQKIVEEVKVDACAVLLYNPKQRTLDFAVKQGFLTNALEFTHLNLGSGIAGIAAKDLRVIYIPNLANIENNPTLTRAIAHENFKVYIGVPLVVKGNLLGVLEIFHRTSFVVDADWLKFIEILANKAAIAIDNARLLGIVQQSYKETNALYQINKKLIATIDPQELMDEVVNLLHAQFGYYYVQIFVADPKSGDVVMRAGSGELGKRLKAEGYHLSPGDGIVGFTADTGNPFFTNNVEDLFAYKRPPHLVETQSELAVPIRIGNQFLGLLDVHQTAPTALEERDVQLVTAVADQLAVALQKAELYTNLQESLRQEKATRAQLVHQEKLIVAGRLLASVSHELNNPIQAIQNALFLLREEEGISTQGKQDLEIVLSETERMASMLQRLRVTYQPVSTADFKDVNINNLIRDVAMLVATHLRHSKITFEFLADEELPAVSGLEDQLRQVMLNLVMNSVEAMRGGGHLSITTKYLHDPRETLITVSDTGKGIDEGILPNIFDAFITNKERGTGLGLTISNEIIIKHGGRIQARNNPEGGAIFQIWLPVSNIKGMP